MTMRSRGFLSALVIFSALALPAAAQAPSPATTAFDGRYVGTGTITHENPSDAGLCRTITLVEMAITRGQVAIHIKYYNTHGSSMYLGVVNETGELSASREVVGHWITVSGIIRDKVFTGASSARASSRNTCFYSFEMASSAPAPMTPFDGWYRGVSREMSDSRSNEPRCYPRALVHPPPPLKVTNGVVGASGESWPWEGTVSPQGVVVLHNPKFSRVDGQIDAQGTIRGQYSGELPPDLQAGGGTNCIVKFVWQKE
jgi:hypothetical protein